MKDILFLSLAISIVFFILRAVELKLVKKQELDLKSVAMDSLYVLISSGFTQLAMSQLGDMGDLSSLMGGGEGGGDSGGVIPGVFTNAPEF